MTMCVPRTSTRSNAARRQQIPYCSHTYLLASHDYHDFGDESSPAGDAATVDEAYLASGHATFPLKLYHMLESVHAEGEDSIVSWQPHGRSFLVHNHEAFRQLLPKYFKLSKMASFQRQLNLYGFNRLTKGAEKGAYYHECFLRSKPFLLARMHRIKVKGTGVRARANPDHEPDFGLMKPLEPSPDSSYEVGSFIEARPLSCVSFSLMDIDSKSLLPESSQACQLNFLQQELKPLSNESKNMSSLSAWGMPYICLGPWTSNADNVGYFDCEEPVDSAFLDQTLHDLLQETDELFMDLVDVFAV